jgi:hypothetical protein
MQKRLNNWIKKTWKLFENKKTSHKIKIKKVQSALKRINKKLW